jgi:hypothetical protein
VYQFGVPSTRLERRIAPAQNVAVQLWSLRPRYLEAITV